MLIVRIAICRLHNRNRTNKIFLTDRLTDKHPVTLQLELYKQIAIFFLQILKGRPCLTIIK